MRRIALFGLLVLGLVACEYGECPVGIELEEADIPCECAGAVVESLSCGAVVCGDAGIELVTGTETVDECVSESKTTNTTALE